MSLEECTHHNNYIDSINRICIKCISYFPNIFFNNDNIGKYFKIIVKDYDQHPKMKFEKHLIEKYPDKYIGYELSFIGKLERFVQWKYEKFVEFDDVSFPDKKQKSKNKSWIINNLDSIVMIEFYHKNIENK